MSYSNKTHVILIKGVVRTTEVSLVKKDVGSTTTYLVYYKRPQEKGKGRLYQYSLKDVTILAHPEVLDPRTHDVFYQGNKLDNVYIICRFKGDGLKYWTIGFADSREDLVCPDGIIITTPRMISGERSKSISRYLTWMAYLHGYDMRTDENIVLLGDQYDHLRRGQYAPLLEAYLNPTVFLNRKTPVCDTPLYPFCTNASQMEALENSLCHRISIIQGPPGTGKTETILSIVLNLVFYGKTVMVVAGSNSAAENVAEKLQQEQMGFLVAKLGRKSNKEAFINEQHTDNLCPSGWAGRSSDEPAMYSKIHQLSTALKDLFILDRQLHKAIEEGDQKTVLNLRKRLVKESYNEKKEELKATSLSLIRQQLFKRFGGDYRRQVYSLEDLGENSVVYESFKKDYPVVISTAYSATKSVAGQALFDYIVMDEASQIDVSTGALALSVAKNAVIVGDVKQLPHVIKADMRVVSEAIFNFCRIPAKYNYATHSFLQSVCDVFNDAPETLLREHYRCHPKIVRFFNREFYSNQLVAMTEDHGEKDVLVLRTTVAGYHAADFTNHREEEEIEDLKRDLGIDGSSASVGIIAPYNNQVRRIDDDEDIEEDIMVSTVHKFQGRQKDVIIISTVDNEYTNFTNDSNLFNVAVSRAKKQLILVTNGNENNSGAVKHLVDYIRESGGRSEGGKVKSLFDLIYPQYESQYKKYISAHPQISQREYAGQDAPSPAERIAFCFITDVLKDYPGLIVRFRYPLHELIPDTSGLDDEEDRFVHNKDSHVDFMIFERETMKPFLAIEIDGASYHIEGSFQGRRDKLKDGILEKYGIPMKRFRTKESINEVNIIKSLLLQIIHMPTHLLMTGIEGTVRD